MAYNRKMRKFEGTCYIPGEQLAMMAKYYRGANLNLNLTLYEEDLETMQETLDQACWCSKLDEVDRMKMAHTKGNEWRLAHEHCSPRGQQGDGGRNPNVYPALPQRSKSTISKVERGTSALSLYDRERGLVWGGRYQRDTPDYRHRWDRNRKSNHDNYHHRGGGYYDNHRNDLHNHRLCWDDHNDNLQNSADDFYEQRSRKRYCNDPSRDCNCECERQNLRSEYNSWEPHYDHHWSEHQSPRRGYHPQGRNEVDYQWNGRYNHPLSRKHDMESEAAMSSLPEVPEIRCAVCNLETCLICKNHLYTPMCQCNCPIANAGLCNRCRALEPCEKGEDKAEEEPQVAQETTCKKMDFSSMMQTMLMNSMFKQLQLPQPACNCKHSRDDPETSSAQSDEKMQRFCDCQISKNHNMSFGCCKCRQKSVCECCKCPEKSKKNSNKKGNDDEEASQNDSDQKRHSRRKDGSRKNKSGKKDDESSSEESSEIGARNKHQPSGKSDNAKKGARNTDNEFSDHESPTSDEYQKRQPSEKKGGEKAKDFERGKKPERGKKYSETSAFENLTTNVNSNLNDTKRVKFSNSENSKVVDEYFGQMMANGEVNGKSIVKGVIGSTQFRLSSVENNSPWKNQVRSTSESNAHMVLCGYERACGGPLQNFGVPMPEKVSPQHDAVGYGSPKEEGLHCAEEETSSPHGLKEFIQCLPNIQSNLQSLMNKLNQMGALNNTLQHPHFDPSLMETQHLTGQDLPPLLQHTMQNSSASFHNSLKELSKLQKPNPSHTFPVPTPQETITLRSTKGEPSNASNHEGNSSFKKHIADQIVQIPVFNEFTETTNKTQSNFRISPIDGENKNQWSFLKESRPFLSPSLIVNSDNDTLQNASERPHADNFNVNSEPGKEKAKRVSSTKYTLPSHSNHFTKLGFPIVEVSDEEDATRKSTFELQKSQPVTATSDQLDIDTISPRFNQVSSRNQGFSEFPSILDKKGSKPLSGTLKKANYNQQDNRNKREAKNPKQHNNHIQKLSKIPRNQKKRPFQRTASAMKVHNGVMFKAKQRSPVLLDKHLQDLTVQAGRKCPRRTGKSKIKQKEFTVKSRIHEKGVGPGKFRKAEPNCMKSNDQRNEIAAPNRSKVSRACDGMVSPTVMWSSTRGRATHDDSSITLEHGLPVNNPDASLEPTTSCRDENNQFLQNDGTLTDSIFQVSNAYIRGKSYVMSSVEFKTPDDCSPSFDILKMIQGIASSTLFNVSSLPPSSKRETLDGSSIIPMIPETSSSSLKWTLENQKDLKVNNLEEAAGLNTPPFLRKSRVQVEQLKRAHETIRSMIRNVNEVIRHIDSDSKIGIASKVRTEDKERTSYFVHLSDDAKKRVNQCNSQDTSDTSFSQNQIRPETFKELEYSRYMQNQEVKKMFKSVNKVINSAITLSKSDETSELPEPENSASSRARREFFMLRSESSERAFADRLRRSLEKDASSSVPLATQISPLPESQRQRSIRPLKRRSWFPPGKR